MDFLENLSKDELTNLIKIFDVQIAIVLVIVFFVTKSVFAKIVINIINKILKKKGNPKESKMYNSIKWMYMMLGIYLAIQILPISGTISVIAKTIFQSYIVIFVTQLINNGILRKDSIIFKKTKIKILTETASVFIFGILRAVTWILAVYIIINSIIGFDLSGIVTALSLGTVIISLAAQDTVKSLLSGLTIISDKPFVIGDWISVGDYAGTVVNITLRSTRIKCADNSTVTIPNSTITESYVVNWSKLQARRISYTLTLDMATSSEKIKKIVKEIKTVLCSKEYVKEDSVYVGFNTISSYSSDITIFLNVTETNYTKYLDLKQELNFEILKILDKENVSLAYPTETVHVKNVDEDKKGKEDKE